MTVFASGRGAHCRPKTAPGGGGGVTTPSILGTVTVDTSSVEPHSSDPAAHTVTAGTEILLAITLYGPNNAPGGAETPPNSDVDGAFAEIVEADLINGSGLAANPRIGLWVLEAPTAGAHVVTRAITGDTLDYSAIVLINLDDVDTSDPIGAAEAVRQPTNSNTFSDSIVTERANSLVIAAAAWQGGDADPISKDLGLTELVPDFQTGGAGTLDSAMAVGTVVGAETPGTVSYGFTASVSDNFAYCAVEIRGADA